MNGRKPSLPDGVEEVESWGIRPYRPDLDTRPEHDLGRLYDQEKYRRRCLYESCRTHRMNPIAELAEDREDSTNELAPLSRVYLFADAWRSLLSWRAEEAPENVPGAETILHEYGAGATEILNDLADVGVLRLIPEVDGSRQRRRTRGSGQGRV